MFERYTEPAKYALFFARHAVTDHGGAMIEPSHLLLGLLRADAASVLRFAHGDETVDSLSERIVNRVAGGAKLHTEAEIPLSDSGKEVLLHAALESDDLHDTNIRPEHLLLGVLAKGSEDDRRALRDSGVEIEAVRKHMRSIQE